MRSKFNLEDREEIYLKALKYYNDFPLNSEKQGLCKTLRISTLIINNEDHVIIQRDFPEIWAHRPQLIPLKTELEFWWPLTEWGRQVRIAVLEEAIRDVKNKVYP